jgi:hypothetical protein
MSKSAFRIAAIAASATLALAASVQAVEIQVGENTGNPGQTVAVDVTLATEGSEVAGTQNDITFGADSGIAIAARSNGRPDCAVNPDIEKGGTSFAFQPSGCTAGTDCTGIRALVLALDNVDPIPDGSVLYTCQVAIAGDATAGDKTLSNTNAGASDPDGGALTTTGQDGRVIVEGGGASDATIIINDASGDAGTTTSFDVALETGTDVAGTQNDIAFADPLSIPARSNGRPDCAVNPDIEKGGTSFAFQPSGCTAGTDCTGIRALVLALDNVDPIPTGSVLYTCQLAIAAGATGTATLTCNNPGASDPDGGALDTDCQDGTVTIGGGGDNTPTSTPTETPSGEVTPTATATVSGVATSTATVTRTRTIPGPPSGNDDDGCAIAAPAQSSAAWMLLLPAAALLWIRRRSR